MREFVKGFIKEEDGIGTIEVVLILAALVAIALIFKDKILELFKDLWNKMFNGEGETFNEDLKLD